MLHVAFVIHRETWRCLLTLVAQRGMDRRCVSAPRVPPDDARNQTAANLLRSMSLFHLSRLSGFSLHINASWHLKTKKILLSLSISCNVIHGRLGHTVVRDTLKTILNEIFQIIEYQRKEDNPA